MEFNAEFLELIILGQTPIDEGGDLESSLLEGPGKASESEIPSSPHHNARREAGLKGSGKLTALQSSESKGSGQSGSTPRTSAIKDASEKTSGMTPRGSGTPRGTGNLTPRSVLAAEEAKNRKAKTLFDDLCGKNGLDNTMRWFQLNSLPHEPEMSEDQFMSFVRSLTKLYDWEVYEVLDILGT